MRGCDDDDASPRPSLSLSLSLSSCNARFAHPVVAQIDCLSGAGIALSESAEAEKPRPGNLEGEEEAALLCWRDAREEGLRGAYLRFVPFVQTARRGSSTVSYGELRLSLRMSPPGLGCVAPLPRALPPSARFQLRRGVFRAWSSFRPRVSRHSSISFRRRRRFEVYCVKVPRCPFFSMLI